MANRNKIYKTGYTKKQSLDINLLIYLGNKRINKKEAKRRCSSKSIESFIIAVVMSSRGRLRLMRLTQITER